MDTGFDRFGPAAPETPLILSVPHAGRAYAPDLLRALRVPPAALLPLEDRLVDTLALAARGNETMIVARTPRAWIDLNRAERERDARVDDGAVATATPHASPKVRAGLGLVPRRASGNADIWNRRFTGAEIAARIAQDHRPYHEALATMLAAARARFGIAILLDIHSMPPVAMPEAPRIVIGDRFGRSAGARFSSRIEGVVRGAQLRCAANAPYAGGHILERHAAPARGIHAIQLEIDRTLYLDASGQEAGPGFAATAALLRSIMDALIDEALPIALAAE
ncbi:N-formylglutamate amidohydrolase [Sphingomonas sp. RS2018]